MATITDLNQTLSSWIRHWRLQRAFTWAWRGLLLGLAFSLIIGSIGLYQARLLQNEFLILVLSVSIITPILFGLIAYLWRIRTLEAARHFDSRFHLKERVSTALELHQHSEQIPPEILDLQLTDAVTSSQNVNTRRAFPAQIKSREGLLVVLFLALIGVLWFRGEAWFQAAAQARAVQQAIAQQNANIEQIIKQIESNPALTEEQKQALTDPLKEAQQGLQNNPSQESSVSALTSAGQKMQALSDPKADAQSQALKESGNQLAKQEGSPLQSVGQNLANGNNVNAANDLANMDVSKLSQAEQQQLANQLQSLAQSMQSTNPQLANQLNQAAQALQNGNIQAAQQALNQAALSLAQAGQQIASSQIANQTASQLQQGAGQVLAVGGGQQGQQANQSGQGQQSQGNQSGQGNQTGQGQGQGQGNGSNQSNQTTGTGGSGSGSGKANGTGQNGTEAGTSPIAQNNGPSNGGESSYEQIYAPQLLGGQGGPQVNLPGSNQNNGDVVGQGPTTPGNPGSSTVPYSEVYSQYQQINNQAIENGDVPPQFMQIIKNYFNSLKP
jgi:hypothetical protein